MVQYRTNRPLNVNFNNIDWKSHASSIGKYITLAILKNIALSFNSFGKLKMG